MSKFLTITLLFLIAFRFWLLLGLEPYVIAAAMHDDGLFASQAFQLARGEWLGEFNELTLIKGIGFPIFIALNYYLGLPILITLHSVFLLSLFLIGFALRKFGVRPALIFLFISISFLHPAFVTIDAARVTRDFFYAVLLSAWLAALFLFIQDYQNLFARKLLSLVSAALFSWLLISREEGIWLIPFSIIFVLFIFWKQKLFNLKKFDLAFLVGCHLLLAVVVRDSIARQNKNIYGEKVLTEFQDSTFKSAYGALLRPNNFPFRQYVPVSREKREALYQVSPSFAELKPYLENPGSNWISPGCVYISPCDDYSSHFVWAFRDAVARAGYYDDSLRDANNFYKKIEQEIDRACNEGKLSCDPNPKSFAPKFRMFYIKPMLSSIWKGIRKISISDVLPPFDNLAPLGGDASVYRFLRMINSPSLSLSAARIVQGWAITRLGENLTVSIEGPGGKENANFQASPDVLAHHKAISYGDFPQYSNARFIVKSDCNKNCNLTIYSNDQLLLKYDLDNHALINKADRLAFNLESDTGEIGLFKKLGNIKFKILDKLSKIYLFIFPKLILITLVLALIGIVRKNYFKQSIVLSFIFFSLLILISTRLVLLSYLDVTAFEGINNLYLMPIFMPFLLLFTVLAELISPKTA